MLDGMGQYNFVASIQNNLIIINIEWADRTDIKIFTKILSTQHNKQYNGR